MSDPGGPSPSVRDAESIRGRRAATALDDGYYVQRETRPGPSARTLTGVVLASFALLFTIAFVQTRNDRPATEAEREALIENIGVRQDLVASKRETVERLQEEIADLQAEAVVQGPGVSPLRVAAGATAVRGPGVVIEIESADDRERPEGRVSDTDVQLVVNGLWLAGAEAVAIDGHRLTSTSAIRSAGEAITVNYRSVGEPIVIEAVGDTNTLRHQWEEGPSGRYLATRADDDGLTWSVRGSDQIDLPVAPEARLRVSARPLRRSTS